MPRRAADVHLLLITRRSEVQILPAQPIRRRPHRAAFVVSGVGFLTGPVTRAYSASRGAARTPAFRMASDSARSGVARASCSVPDRSPSMAAASARPMALPCLSDSRPGEHRAGLICVLSTGMSAWLPHADHDLAFCSPSFDVRQCFVGRLKRKDRVHDRANVPVVEQRCNFAQLVAICPHE
jgi:hypothetical protein